MDTFAVDTIPLQNIFGKMCQEENSSLREINIIVGNDNYLLEINREFLQHDYYTDIITFDYSRDETGVPLAELYLSLDRIKENSSTRRVALLREFHRVIIHGLLHLCGYDDKTEEQKRTMSIKEDFYLNLLSGDVSRETIKVK